MHEKFWLLLPALLHFGFLLLAVLNSLLEFLDSKWLLTCVLAHLVLRELVTYTFRPRKYQKMVVQCESARVTGRAAAQSQGSG